MDNLQYTVLHCWPEFILSTTVKKRFSYIIMSLPAKTCGFPKPCWTPVKCTGRPSLSSDPALTRAHQLTSFPSYEPSLGQFFSLHCKPKLRITSEHWLAQQTSASHSLTSHDFDIWGNWFTKLITEWIKLASQGTNPQQPIGASNEEAVAIDEHHLWQLLGQSTCIVCSSSAAWMPHIGPKVTWYFEGFTAWSEWQISWAKDIFLHLFIFFFNLGLLMKHSGL